MRTTAVLLGTISLAAFATSVFVHVGSFVPGAPVSMDWAFVLHLVAMALCLAMAGHGSVLLRRARRGEPDKKDEKDKKDETKWFEQFVPQPVKAAFLTLFFYAIVNFCIFAARVEGRAEVENGGYVLTYKGRFVRTLTAGEYEAHRRLEVRGPAGHWMLFTAIPTIYFLIIYPRARAAVEAAKLAPAP